MLNFFKIIFLTASVTLSLNASHANSLEFNNWLKNFKEIAVKQGVSQNTIDKTFKNIKFIPKVIEYDRYQPEFYEDTFTYINKRAN